MGDVSIAFRTQRRNVSREIGLGMFLGIAAYAASIAATCVDVDASDSAPVSLDRVAFGWNLIGSVENDGAHKTIELRDGAVVRSGDGIRLIVEPGSGCAIYVLHQSPGGIFSLVFKREPAANESSGDKGDRIRIPSADGWMRLDSELGSERFFVLGTPTPLPRLDELLDLNGAADPAARQEIAARIDAEISALASKHKSLSKLAERPAIIGGMVRSLPSVGSEPPLIEVRESDLFLHVVTLEHH